MPRWTGDRGRTTAKLWLFLLRAGGRWLSGDVAKATKMDPSLVGWLLAAMTRCDNAKKFPVAGKNRRFSYGVTAECRIPRCVSMGEIAECLAIQPVEEIGQESR
jgi:hypothetical protein